MPPKLSDPAGHRRNAPLLELIEPSEQSESVFPYFDSLKHALRQIFLQKSTNASNCRLSKDEQVILQAILAKKKFPVCKKLACAAKSVRHLAGFPLRRLKEYNVKFVLSRCIKRLKQVFFQNLEQPGTRRAVGIRRRDRLFYAHYFGDVSQRRGIPLERFYAFKNWTHRYAREIPKSITRQSIRLWSLSPRFISDVCAYIDDGLLADTVDSGQAKIMRMLRQWNRMVIRLGHRAAVKQIVAYLGSSACKLPWTVSEVKFAMRSVRAILVD